MNFTTRLALSKPDPNPVTGDFVDIAVLNANMDKLDAGIGATICTAATRPASPFHGQIIRETDTRKLYVWNATQSAWDQIYSANGTPQETEFTAASTGAFSNTTAAAGTPVCGGVFTAPPSGKVVIHLTAFAEITAGTSTIIHFSREVRTGNVLGSGTLVVASGQVDALLVGKQVSDTIQASLRLSPLSLTPGAQYNVQGMHWVVGTTPTGILWTRRINVQPVL